jgi:metal-responsive CopG/Arc/MetJ family transcriptional regulator
MKTAISLPDPLFSAAEQLSKRLGMSRSKLYATAIARYVETQKTEGVTEALNRVYAEGRSTLDKGLLRLQSASLPREKW